MGYLADAEVLNNNKKNKKIKNIKDTMNCRLDNVTMTNRSGK